MKTSFKIIMLLIFIWPFNLQKLQAQEEIKIGLLIPLSGKQSDIGKSIIQSVRLAINKIDNPNIKILPKDTKNDPVRTLAAAKELKIEGVKIVIGPIFNNNLIYLNELKEMIFLSLTNKSIKNPKNIISAGINANSQIKTIMKFKKMNNINKTIFLIPNSDFREEIENAISQSKIKLKYIHIYETNPTKLTKQIEKITMYKIRKQNAMDEIKRLENSNEENKEWKVDKLKKKRQIWWYKF
jgi:ABC-type branched-subunit amino acid transport system substrate-binding protein